MGRKKQSYAPSSLDLCFGPVKGFEHSQYVISINGTNLTDYLNDQTGCRDFDLLLPPIGLYSRSEQEQILELLGRRNVVMPVLVCSDDMDFSCTVVSTYVIECKDYVLWDGFGYGLTMRQPIHAPRLAFERACYDAFAAKVRCSSVHAFHHDTID